MVSRRVVLAGIISGVVTPLSGCSTGVLADPDPTSTDIDTETDTEDTSELIAEVVRNYGRGYDGMEASKERLHTAVDSMKQDNYDVAIIRLEGFEYDIEPFGSSFEEAANGAEELGSAEVMRAALAGKAEVSALKEAGITVRSGAKDAQNEHWDEADEKLSQSQSYINQAEQEHQNVLKPENVENRLNEFQS